MKRNLLDRTRIIAGVCASVLALIFIGRGHVWQHRTQGQVFQVWGAALLFLSTMAHFLEAVLRFSRCQELAPRRLETQPPAASLWTIHTLLAALVALLNSPVYIGGGLL